MVLLHKHGVVYYLTQFERHGKGLSALQKVAQSGDVKEDTEKRFKDVTHDLHNDVQNLLRHLKNIEDYLDREDNVFRKHFGTESIHKAAKAAPDYSSTKNLVQLHEHIWQDAEQGVVALKKEYDALRHVLTGLLTLTPDVESGLPTLDLMRKYFAAEHPACGRVIQGVQSSKAMLGRIQKHSKIFAKYYDGLTTFFDDFDKTVRQDREQMEDFTHNISSWL